tara:strand:+ start:340 stop:507 length:168 start_codon:yes stop_codon:yes gene_type:complete
MTIQILKERIALENAIKENLYNETLMNINLNAKYSKHTVSYDWINSNIFVDESII